MPERCDVVLADVGLTRGTSLHGHLQEATRHREAIQQNYEDVRVRHAAATDRRDHLLAVGPAEEAALNQNHAAATEVSKLAQEELQASSSDVQRSWQDLGYVSIPEPSAVAERRQKADRRRNNIGLYSSLEGRWFELTGLSQTKEKTAEDEMVEQIGDDLLKAANLIAATTVGIAGAAGKFVRGVDFDTLIVDEASRVTDSEFLIGAVRARRWILVGDEKQLPPYVEQDDEHHLHALAALYRVDRGAAADLETSVKDLAALWKEDEELHQYRHASVLKAAERIRTDGSWESEYRATFRDCHEYFGKSGADPDRRILQTMIDYLVRSLFERCVEDGAPSLKERLVVQRRMIEPIAAIVRDPIYQGEYHSPPQSELEACGVIPLTTATFSEPVVFLDTSAYGPRAHDSQKGNGFVNELEQEWVVAACRAYERDLRARNDRGITVSILCFYRAQAQEIRARLGAPDYRSFRKLRFQVIDAIDRIQGQESDLVLISFCRTHFGNPSPQFGQWLQDLRRLNVACTRAHRAIVFVGHQPTLSRLCASDEAKSFYDHLLRLPKEPGARWTVLKDFQ